MTTRPLTKDPTHLDVEVASSAPPPVAVRPPVRWHSVSSTREYERCPRRYRYAYVDRLPQDRHVPIAWRVGSAVHAALEAAYRTKQDDPQQPLMSGLPGALSALRQAWVELELPFGDVRYQQAGRHVERNIREDVLDVGEIIGVELPLRSSPAAGNRIAGFLDLLLRRDATTVEIVDHKVTSRRASSANIASDFQLNLYADLVRARWPEVTTIRATLYYPTGPDQVSATLTDEGIAAARSRVDRAAIAAEADTTFVPQPAAHCSHCPWRPRCPAEQ